MLWEDKVILSSLKKRAFRKDLRDRLKVLEKEIRKEKTALQTKNACRYPNIGRKSCSQDTTDPVEVTQNPTIPTGINKGAGEDLAEKKPDLNVVQEMLFTDGALDMEKLLCLHLLAKQSFIGRIRRTQVPFRLPRREKRRDQVPQASVADFRVLPPGRRCTVDLSSISFMSKKVYVTPSQPIVSGNHRKKALLQISDAGRCMREEESLEQLVDSVLEALCEANPTKLCTLLQMECDEDMLDRVLTSHKVQHFMQQVCGRGMRYGKSQSVRGAKSVPELLKLQRAKRLFAERHLSSEDMFKLRHKLHDAGFRVDLLEDIEDMVDALWREELANKKSESDITSDSESRKILQSLASYSSSDSLSTQLSPVHVETIQTTKRSTNLVHEARQQHSWQQKEQQQTPSLLSRLSATMSTHSDLLHQKVKADVCQAEAIDSGETTDTIQQYVSNTAQQDFSPSTSQGHEHHSFHSMCSPSISETEDDSTQQSPPVIRRGALITRVY